MAVSDRIAAHFRDNVFWGGLTYNAHPMCLAAAEAAVNVLIEEGMVENSAKMGVVMRGHMERLKGKHRCVRTHRNIGLFGLIELRKNAVGAMGERLAPYNGAHPVAAKLSRFLRDNGVFTLVAGSNVMCNPPLCITEAQMGEAFGVIDKGWSWWMRCSRGERRVRVRRRVRGCMAAPLARGKTGPAIEGRRTVGLRARPVTARGVLGAETRVGRLAGCDFRGNFEKMDFGGGWVPRRAQSRGLCS